MKIAPSIQLVMKTVTNAAARKVHKLNASICRAEFKKTHKFGAKKSAHAHSH